jgi:hypothetical protein
MPAYLCYGFVIGVPLHLNQGRDGWNLNLVSFLWPANLDQSKYNYKMNDQFSILVKNIPDSVITALDYLVRN